MNETDKPKGIRIRQLRFDRSMDIPGKGMENSLAGAGPEAPKNQMRHEIEYQPGTRHHRISWFEVGKDKPKMVIYVHETKVLSWEAW